MVDVPLPLCSQTAPMPGPQQFSANQISNYILTLEWTSKATEEGGDFTN
jgi:hypothetical protein